MLAVEGYSVEAHIGITGPFQFLIAFLAYRKYMRCVNSHAACVHISICKCLRSVPCPEDLVVWFCVLSLSQTFLGHAKPIMHHCQEVAARAGSTSFGLRGYSMEADSSGAYSVGAYSVGAYSSRAN